MSEKVKHYFEEFIKKSILLVINSRIKPKNELKLQYETLSLTSDNKSKCDNQHKNNSNDFFDIDDLFLDEYDVLTYAKGLNKRYTIDNSEDLEPFVYSPSSPNNNYIQTQGNWEEFLENEIFKGFYTNNYEIDEINIEGDYGTYKGFGKTFA